MERSLEGKEIILGVTGSIAAYKAVEILRELTRRGAAVTVVMTESAQRFVAPLTFETLSRPPLRPALFTLEYDKQIGHVASAGRADLLLVAPATANTIAKFARGLADDFLSNIYLSSTCPVVLAPAMDLEMYAHRAVQDNLSRLKTRGVSIVEPEFGELASGMIGRGRLAELSAILQAVEDLLHRQGDLKGETVLVAAGPRSIPVQPLLRQDGLCHRRGRPGSGGPRDVGERPDRASHSARRDADGRHRRRRDVPRRAGSPGRHHDPHPGGGRRRLSPEHPGSAEDQEARGDDGGAGAQPGHPSRGGAKEGIADTGRLCRRDGGADPERAGETREEKPGSNRGQRHPRRLRGRDQPRHHPRPSGKRGRVAGAHEAGGGSPDPRSGRGPAQAYFIASTDEHKTMSRN